MGRPRAHHRRVAACAEAWQDVLGIGGAAARILVHGIYDPPDMPEWGVGVLGSVPQTDEETRYGLAELERGCGEEELYEEVPHEEAMLLVHEGGYMASSAFVHWEGMEEDGVTKKGRFVQSFSRMSEWWVWGASVRMESPAAFAAGTVPGERFLSFDIRAGYRHFKLHPSMRNYFLFHYAGRFFRCIALPFGWSRSPFWFTSLVKPVVNHLRTCLDLRVLPYIDDFLLSLGLRNMGQLATEEQVRGVSRRVQSLLDSLGLQRHPTKGVWGAGATRLDHLGLTWDSGQMCFTVTKDKIKKINSFAKRLMRQASLGRRWVSRMALSSFCGTAISLYLAFPLARFYTRSLYDAVKDYGSKKTQAARGGVRTRLSTQAVKDLRVWSALGECGRRFVERDEGILAIHTDAAELGWGGSLGTDLTAGVPGNIVSDQGVWSASERLESITCRELQAVNMLLGRQVGLELAKRPDVTRLRAIGDNMAVKFIVNAMVSASPRVMPQVRVLKSLLDRAGIPHDRPLGVGMAEWLPSAENWHSDRLSRTWDPGDLSVRKSLRDSLRAAYSFAPNAEGCEPFKWNPLGTHPVAVRKQTITALNEAWDHGRARLFCPPPDLIPLTLRKIRSSGACGVLLVPNWPTADWFPFAWALADRSWVLERADPRLIWSGRRSMNPKWTLLVLEIGLRPRTVVELSE